MQNEILYALASCVVITELILCILPEGSLKRFCRFAAGMLLSLMLLSVLSECNFDLNFQIDESERSMVQIDYEHFVQDVYNSASDNIINNR